MDTIWYNGPNGHAFESRINSFFIIQLENILSNLKFSTSYGRLTDLKSLFGLLLLSFIWLGEKISLKYLLIGGGAVVHHAHTVSTSLMSKLVKAIILKYIF